MNIEGKPPVGINSQHYVVPKKISQVNALDLSRTDAISPDNPLYLIIEQERELLPAENIKNSIEIINGIVNKCRTRTANLTDPQKKIETLFNIVKEDLNIEYKYTYFLSEGLTNNPKTIDCDTMAFLYLVVGHELNWPVNMVVTAQHVILRWQDEKQTLYFDPTYQETLTLHFETKPPNFNIPLVKLIKNERDLREHLLRVAIGYCQKNKPAEVERYQKELENLLKN